MAAKEKTGIRSLTPSAWHRKDSIERFVDSNTAKGMTMQDIDCVEYDNATKTPLLLTEVGLDVNQKDKPIGVLTKMSDMFGRAGVCVPFCTILYTPSDKPNPCIEANIIMRGLERQMDEIKRIGGVPDIESFRVRCPSFFEDSNWYILSPKECALFLVNARNNSYDVSRLMNLPQQR